MGGRGGSSGMGSSKASLPSLEGTAKQVAWAEDIRNNVFHLLDIIAEEKEVPRGYINWGNELANFLVKAFDAKESEYDDYSDKYDFSAAEAFKEKYGYIKEKTVNGKTRHVLSWKHKKLARDYKNVIKNNKSASEWIERRKGNFGPWQKSMTYSLINKSPNYVDKDEYWKSHKPGSGII